MIHHLAVLKICSQLWAQDSLPGSAWGPVSGAGALSAGQLHAKPLYFYPPYCLSDAKTDQLMQALCLFQGIVGMVSNAFLFGGSSGNGGEWVREMLVCPSGALGDSGDHEV